MLQSRFRHRLLAALLASTLGSSVAIAATYEQALQAYERGNYTVAIQGFTDLANSGDADAMYMLGRLYARGSGVIQDQVQAHKWFNLAAARGSRRAAEARDDLANEMSQRQLSQAQRLARDWQPTSTPPSTPTYSSNEPLTRKEVARLQQTLNDLGYDAGKADGRMGGRSRSAIRQFQTDQELRVTGEPTRDVYDQIIAAANNEPTSERRDERYDERRDEQRDQEQRFVQERTLFSDSFRDGDYTRNPRWQVDSGRFWVQNSALYTEHTPPQSLSQPLQQQQKRPEDLPLAILETLLQQAAPGVVPNAPPELPFAEIYLPQTVTNAFTISMQIGSLAPNGRLELGPYQGNNRDTGYRLVYKPNDQRGIGLIRRTRSGFEIIETAGRPLNLEDGRIHELVWSRDPRGNMTVSVDGATLLQASDRTFRDNFSGFTLLNWGGSYVLHEITAQGPDL